jgi:TRAP-type C4-dicarboxylate transport system permease small subunit
MLETPAMRAKMARAARAARRLLAVPVGWMNAAASWSYIIAAVFITGDALSRQFLGVSSGATTELSGYILAFGISWSLGQTMLERAHIRIDFLVMKLPLRIRQYLHLFALVLLLAMVVVLFWSVTKVIDQTILFDAHDISALSTPLIVPQGLWASGIAAFALLLIVLTVESVALIANGEAAEVDRLLRSRGEQEEVSEIVHAIEPGGKTR